MNDVFRGGEWTVFIDPLCVFRMSYQILLSNCKNGVYYRWMWMMSTWYPWWWVTEWQRFFFLHYALMEHSLMMTMQTFLFHSILVKDLPSLMLVASPDNFERTLNFSRRAFVAWQRFFPMIWHSQKETRKNITTLEIRRRECVKGPGEWTPIDRLIQSVWVLVQYA